MHAAITNSRLESPCQQLALELAGCKGMCAASGGGSADTSGVIKGLGRNGPWHLVGDLVNRQQGCERLEASTTAHTTGSASAVHVAGRARFRRALHRILARGCPQSGGAWCPSCATAPGGGASSASSRLRPCPRSFASGATVRRFRSRWRSSVGTCRGLQRLHIDYRNLRTVQNMKFVA